MRPTWSKDFWLTRFVFLRALAFVYAVGFLILVRQFEPLLGEHGLLPVRQFLSEVPFWQTPSLFYVDASDGFCVAIAWMGLGLSLVALSSLSDRFGATLHAAVFALLWVFYLSFVNVGQVFWSYGWETLLLEVGFLAIFFGPMSERPDAAVVGLLRWVLFRLMLGAGLIKLRGDPCWRDLTCLLYHYETQPLPNPLSWYFQHLPVVVHKAGVLFTFFVELIVPWGFFGPRFVATLAGLFTTAFQLLLIASGNLAWLTT